MGVGKVTYKNQGKLINDLDEFKWKHNPNEDKANEIAGILQDAKSPGGTKLLAKLEKQSPELLERLRKAQASQDKNEFQATINEILKLKKGGLVRKHQFGKKLVEGTKKAGKEAVTDTVIGNALDSRKSDRDFDMIDAVSLGASFVPGLNVASAAFDAGRNLYDEYKAGDLDSKDFVRNGLDFATNLIPGAKAAKGAFKVTKQLMKPKTAAKVANLSKLIFTN